jgi:hypothetical protein
MKARKILTGTAIALALVAGATGTAGAHWDDAWHDPGLGPGTPGPEIGMYPNDDWHQPAIGIYPDDWWENPGIRVHPHLR